MARSPGSRVGLQRERNLPETKPSCLLSFVRKRLMNHTPSWPQAPGQIDWQMFNLISPFGAFTVQPRVSPLLNRPRRPLPAHLVYNDSFLSHNLFNHCHGHENPFNNTHLFAEKPELPALAPCYTADHLGNWSRKPGCVGGRIACFEGQGQ